ncbi:Nucleic acid-binding OB-fold [Penicillium expansum]|nr:Nucleic acid-binding OB-fold [Penicillium expansum]
MQLCRCDGAKQDRRQGDPDVRFDPEVAMAMVSVARHSRKDAQKSVNLDFDARVPIPFSVFPSSYRSDAVSETTQTRVEGEVNFDRTSRVEREDTRGSAPLPAPVHGKEEVEFRIQEERPRIQEEHPQYAQQSQQYPQQSQQYTQQYSQSQSQQYPSHQPSHNYAPEVELTRERYPSYQQPSVDYEDRSQVYDKVVETQIDLTERDYRERTSPSYDLDVSYDRRYRQPVDSAYGYQSESVDVSYDRASNPRPTLTRQTTSTFVKFSPVLVTPPPLK